MQASKHLSFLCLFITVECSARGGGGVDDGMDGWMDGMDGWDGLLKDSLSFVESEGGKREGGRMQD